MANVEVNNNGYIPTIVEINDALVDVYANFTYSQRISSTFSNLRSFDNSSSNDIYNFGTYILIPGGLSWTGLRYTVNWIGQISNLGSNLTKYEIIDNLTGDLVAFLGNLNYSSIPIVSRLSQGSTISNVIVRTASEIVIIEAAATQGISSIDGTISKITSAYITSSDGINLTAFASEVVGNISFAVPTTNLSNPISVSGIVNEFGVARVTANQAEFINSGLYTVTDSVNFSGLSLDVSSTPTTDVLSGNDTIRLNGNSSITFNSSSGSDLIYSHNAQDVIDGGVGRDIVVYLNPRSAYLITKNSNSNYVVSEIGNSVNTDNLTNVEILRFSDQDYFIGINTPTSGSVNITGTTTQGQVLTASNNLVDIDGLGSITYTWFASGSDVAIGTGTTYTLKHAEVGKTITVVASYTDGNSTVESKTSAATIAVANVNDLPTGTVSISGTATQGQVLTASNNLIDIDGLGSITYTWFASGSDVAIGTGTTYTLKQAEVGKTITVVASYTDVQGALETKVSASSIAVTNINDTPTGSVTISGPAVEGQILTAGNILADADGLGNITYTWFANGTTQVGIGSTYTLTQAEIDKTITVIASYTDGYNTAESKTSSSTSIVVAAIPYNLIGTPNVDTLTGGLLSDTLTGIGSTDILNGGEDSDLYIMTLASDHSAAEINDTGINGTDEVRFTSTIASTLNLYAGDKGIEKVAIGTGSAAIADSTGTTALNINAAALTNAIIIIGNSGANTLTGTGFHDTLDGGLGVDSLIGGAGDDTYLVDLTVAGALQDTVTEAAVTGIDTIRLRGSSTNAVAVALTLGLNIEHLDASATGTSKLNLTGNTLANTLTGNAFDNILDGGAGADSLIGGAGNDTYLVDNALDVVTEALDEGVADLVRINIAVAATTANPYVLTSNVENGTLINTVAYSLTGNDLNNSLTGNAAANTLTGLGGDDTLNGLGGIDTMVGGIGNDTYIVDNVADVVTELTTDLGTDLVQAAAAYSLNTVNAAGVENLTLTGAAVINGTGNALNNIITGNAAANVLDGGAGNDTLIGGLGNDTYVVDSLADSITEGANAGTDLVQLAITSAAVTYVLGTDLENATITDTTQNHNLTGNAAANTLTGNGLNNILDGGAGNDTLIAGAGDDLLDGGLGNDTMSGGAGDDQYIVDSATDIVNELALDGNDVINTTLTTFTLGANLEDLIYGGSSNFTGTGNAADNYIEGDLGADKLNGGAGNDILTGGAGSDTFIFATALNALTNVDSITDFTAGDKIQLSRAIFTTVGLAGNLNADFFQSGTVAIDANDRIIYNSSNGGLYYDADGSGVGAQIQFATLIGLPTVTHADFVIVA